MTIEAVINIPRMFGVVLVNERVLEAYVGEYASGKSEISINRAISLLNEGRKVTLVDLDFVEPFYTLRPVKKELSEMGIDVVAWDTADTVGLGEAGSLMKPEMRWVLKRPGDVILDIGYGVEGYKILNLIEGALEGDLRIFAVLNVGRPMTSELDEIVEYVKTLGPINGLINNSHLGEDTTVEFVQQGARIITQAAEILGLPVVATYLEKRWETELSSRTDTMGNPIRFLHRFMAKAFW